MRTEQTNANEHLRCLIFTLCFQRKKKSVLVRTYGVHYYNQQQQSRVSVAVRVTRRLTS